MCVQNNKQIFIVYIRSSNLRVFHMLISYEENVIGARYKT